MAKRYGVLPSTLINLPPEDFALNMTVAIRAEAYELEKRVGEFWWLRVMEMFTGKGSKNDDEDVKWL